METSRNAKCLLNLKQLGAANLAFSQDHAGLIAAGGTWEDYWWHFQLRPYLGSNPDDFNQTVVTLICPSDETKGWGDPPNPTNLNVTRRSYGVNNHLRHWQTGPRRLREFLRPAATVYAGDRILEDTNWISGDTYFLDRLPRKRHDGRANHVFLDGHAETIEIATLYPGNDRSGIFTGE